jgi:hypothetical protein
MRGVTPYGARHLFLPGDAVFDSGSHGTFPPKIQARHHEVEIFVALASGGATSECGTWGKGSDRSAPVEPQAPGIPPAAGGISLKINRQLGDTLRGELIGADLIHFGVAL